MLLFVLSDAFDDNKLYKDKYKCYSDEVVSKVMAKVNEDIKAIKKREQIFIKVDGKGNKL